MSAHGTPAAAGTTTTRGPFAPDRRDWLRLLGGVTFAAGALVLAIRRGGDWSEWAILAVLLVPCVLLYALAFSGRRATRALDGWESGFLAFAVLLLPLALFQLVEALEGDTSSELNIAWIFGVSAAVAAVTALAAGARWQMLIAGLYAGAAWLALWSRILDEISQDRLRTVLAGYALIVLLAAVVLARLRRPFASDLITVAGLAALLVTVVHLSGLASETVDVEGIVPEDARPEEGWNIALLGVSLLLIAFGSRARTRGPAYVGALGLAVFVAAVGLDVVTEFDGEDPRGVAGWPLVLLIGGALAAALSFVLPRGSGPTTRPPDWDTGAPRAPRQPAAGPVVQQPTVQQPAPAAPPPPGQEQGGGRLLDQWRSPPPPGQG